MSYQVIARKWRPQSFKELVGQAHVSQTLINALQNDRLHHALLFTGPRGTGKTSSARILAKSLRCPHAVDFVPCHICDSCLEIAQGRSVDVIEIDGASNNGVDAIRDLRETVGYMPASGRTKIYIIDEVHMLSTSAFNALLKTLEEPPQHVIFILATTEVQKIPQTILSRCQRYDFRRISTREIAERLILICQTEFIEFEEEALWTIARQGDGSMRDSQSLLDQSITFTNGQLTNQNVAQILGLTERTLLLEVLQSIIGKTTKETLSIIERFSVSGIEPYLFIKDLIDSIRNLLLAKISGNKMSSLLEIPDSEYAILCQIAEKMEEEELHLLFDMALKGASDIHRASDPRTVLEVLLLRMTSAPSLVQIQSLIETVRSSSSGIMRVSPSTSCEKDKKTIPKILSGHERLKEASNLNIIPASLQRMKKAVEEGLDSSDRWLAFIGHIRQDDALFAAKIENLLFVRDDGQKLILSIPPKLSFLEKQISDETVRKKLQGYIDSFWGSGYSFEVEGGPRILGESATSLAQKKKNQEEEELKILVSENSLVRKVNEVFGAQIKSILPLNEDNKIQQ